MENNDVDARIKELQQTIRVYGSEAYADAQLQLGDIYRVEKQDYNQAITHYNNVTETDNPEAYANAQQSLGYIYQDAKQDYNQAITHYNNVTEKNNPEVYTLAQLYLGDIYRDKKQDYNQAITHYNNITEENNPLTYVMAQFNLGNIYKEVKQDYNQAITHYNNITENSHLIYAWAQLNLGNIYREVKQDYNQAITHYNNVTRKDNPKTYASAQHNLGNIYKEVKQDYNQAITHYNDVNEYDNPQVYAQAQYQLAHIYFFEKNNNNKARKHYNNVEYFSSDSYRYISARVISELIDVEPEIILKKEVFKKSVLNKIKEICESVNKIEKELLVSFDINNSTNDNKEEKKPERRVAHYTRPEVLFNLLKGNPPSKFRLNIADIMNDPSENRILTDWLKISNNSDNEIKSFLASFSFNHNSLNQFRLYGNEDNIVGSSVSIAFNQDFFGLDTERSINDKKITIPKINAVQSSNDAQVKLESEYSEFKIDDTLHSLPLYRCLYFDPETKYMTLAKRNKQSFYQEMYDEKKNTKYIDAEWKAYTEVLNEEETIDEIRDELKIIKESIDALLTKKELEKIPNLTKLLSLAVLPIACLIKHAAFEYEDECRMIYITHISDEKIVEPKEYQSADSLYVEYTNVEDYIDSVFLGPQCKTHHKLWLQNHFKKNQGKEVKLIESEMPLR